ncbi:MAG: CpaD family pilus assembly lipoprotein [Caulobacteraceae bacterium]|nr:CpaD family pilus assembly lipoprotein [Caulobacteraceae bacterium]
MTSSLRPARIGAVLLFAALAMPVLSGCVDRHPESADSAQTRTAAQPICQPADPSPGAAVTLPEEGCWNAANLAKMVADPADLTQGKPLGPADGSRETAVIDAYKRGPPKTSPEQSTNKPTIVIGGGTDTGTAP